MIDASLSVSAAGARAWDFIVIGGGPAGGAAALRLARLGHRVLLVDRSHFPRPKVCGCCLSPAAIRELAALELPAGTLPEAVPLTAVRLACAGRSARVAMTGGATVSREALDAALVRAAMDAGAVWLPGVTVTGTIEEDSGAVVNVRSIAGGVAAIRARGVVIAAGLADAIRVGIGPASRRARRVAAQSRIGLGATLPATAGHLPAGELMMAVSHGGYAGIVRLEDGRLDLAAAVAPELVSTAGSPAAALAAVLSEAGGVAATSVRIDAVRTARVLATPPLTHASPLASGPQAAILRIGDAAAYVEPFTGEGIGWALASARLLGAAAEATGGPGPALAARYGADHTRLFTPRHARCQGVARAVRRPWLLAGAVRLADAAPAVASRVLPWLVGGERLP